MEDTEQLDPISAAVQDMVKNQSPETPAEAPVQAVKQEQEVEQEQVETQEAATETEATEPEVISFGEPDEQPEQVEEKFKELTSQRDALLEKLKEKENAQVFANEQIRKLNDFVLNGGQIDRNFWELQEKDYDSVDFSKDQDLLRVLKDEYMLISGLSEKEAARMLAKTYPALHDKESADEDDVFDEMIQLKSAVKAGLPKLQDLKSRAALPKEDKEAQRRNQEALQVYQAEADKALSAIKEFKVQLSDDFAIKISKDKESEKHLRNLILYPENQSSYFVDNYVKDGKPNFQRFAEDEFFRRHRDAIIKTAYNQGLSAGTKSVIQKELRQENPSGPKEKQTANNSLADYSLKLKQQLNS